MSARPFIECEQIHAGLAVSDRIRLWIDGDPSVLEAVRAHCDWIAEEVLATATFIDESGQASEHKLARQTVDLDGIHADLALTRDE